MASLTFETLTLTNCGSYLNGPNVINLNNPRQLIYVTGENKVEPSLGSNDIGKSTLINSLYWCLTGKTLRSSRPGAAIEPWDNDETSIASLTFIKDSIPHIIVRNRRPNSLSIDDQTVTQDQVTKLIGLSDEAIKHTLIIGQFNELFISLRPEEQSSLFAELLNLDVWIKAVELCSKKIREGESNITMLENVILKLEGGLTENQELIKATQELAKEFDIKKETFLKELQTSLEAIALDLNKITTKLNQSKIDLDQLPNISQKEDQLKGLQAREVANRDIINKASIKTAGIDRELHEVATNLKAYQETDSRCPACGQRVDLEHINEKISDLSIRHLKLLNTSSNSTNLYNKRKLDLRDVQDQIKVLEESLEDARDQIRECNQHYNAYLLQTSKKQAEVEQLQKEIISTTNSTNPHNAALAELNNRKSVIELSLSKQQNQLADRNKALGHLKIWLDGFKQIRLDIIDETLDELEVTSNKHAARLGLDEWEIGFHTERETQKGDVRHKFTINIFPPNLDYPVPFETLGGGVSTRLQLAVFFGLSEVLLARAGITPNIEFLDEITRHLSDEGIKDLIECLKERAADTGRAIYFIDHRMLDRGDFDNTIWIEKDQSGSRIIA